MNADETKKKIDSVGNIRIIFEPSIYQENLLPKENLKGILEKSRVSLRGWDFPHIPINVNDNMKPPYSIGNGYEFYTNFQEITEIFRFYQSGQFIGRIQMREDAIDKALGKTIEPGKYLDFLNTVYLITEITLFIKNLMENTDIFEGKLIIEIDKTKGRELQPIFSSNILPFFARYICETEKVQAEVGFDKQKISTDPLAVARILLKNIFLDFNWDSYSEQTITTHQENLLNRKI